MIYRFFEEMLFYPKWYHYFFIFILLPFSFLYYIAVLIKFPRKFKDLGVPVISVGNIIVGGSGKTPFTISLANKLDKRVGVVLRGYGRKSKGVVVVKSGDILVDVDMSGDEAMEIALFSKAEIVVVSEDREEGIKKAKSLGAEVVLLDDGFDKPFKKLNIVIDEKIKNPFLLPAGGYRYPRSFLKYADIVIDNLKRRVKCPKGDILVSAISKPKRLLKFCNMEYKFFKDHYDFKEEDIKEFKDKVVVCTRKDYVKLKKFGLNLKVIELDVEIEKDILNKINQYLVKFYKKGK